MINIRKSVLHPCQNLEFLGGRNKFEGHDFSTSRRKDEKHSGAVSVLLKEVISDSHIVESGDTLVSPSSHCSSAYNSTVLSKVMSANNEIFHGERFRSIDKLLRGGQGRNEFVGTKYSFKQKENTIIKSSSVNKCVFEKLGC